MSDDLIEKLNDRRVCSPAQNSCRNDHVLNLAEARIEELEVKLATCRKYRDAYAECDRISTHALRKAVEALDEAVYLLVPDEEDMAKKAGVYRIVTTLAELKGETDG